MRRFGWLTGFIDRLAEEGVAAGSDDAGVLAPARMMTVATKDWGAAGRVAQAHGFRFAGIWGDPIAGRIVVRACLELMGDYLVMETHAPLKNPVLSSYTPYFPGAGRLERHMRDMLGVSFHDHPDSRRWTRHQAWTENEHPLLPDFPAQGRPPVRTPADTDYGFVPIQGSGVLEIPVGPVHAGIIEPGHFRFHAVGEDVLRLEERLGYVHKGIEKIAVGRDAYSLARLAGRVSGDSAVAHTWAACQAMERAAGFCVPKRGLYLRALMAERERVANHLGDIGAICNDVAFSFAHMSLARLRERWQRRSKELFGHRLMMDAIVPGGAARDIDGGACRTLLADNDDLARAIEPLFDIIEDHSSLDDRLIGAGVLGVDDARALGCTGYVGKASGQRFDVRKDSPYAPYDGMDVRVPLMTDGDVAARVTTRIEEIRASLDLMGRLIANIPHGDIAGPWAPPQNGAAGLGIIDGWRGEIVTYVRFGEGGLVERFFPRDPSWFTWPALERLIHGNIVPDFPVCNKSVNGSYSGHDL